MERSFAVGDRVGQEHGGKYSPEGEGPSYGVITDVLSDGSVMVKWDSKWLNDSRRAINPKKLTPEAELVAKYSALEAAFHKVEQDVRTKLKEASQFILDAGKIAKEAGFSLSEMYDATSTLESAMGKAGWNTSSWHC